MKQTILLICEDYKPKLGGGAELAHKVALALHRRGLEILVVGPEAEAKRFDSQQPFETIRSIPVRGKELFQLPRFSLDLLVYCKNLWQLIKKRKVDYILVTDTGYLQNYSGLLRGLALIGLNIPVGRIFHGQDVISVPKVTLTKRRLMHSVVRKIDDAFCNSNFTAEAFKMEFGCFVRPVVIGCGVDPYSMPPSVERQAARKKLNINTNNVILSVCHLVPRKGVDMVIKSLPEVIPLFPDLLYVVAGAGPDLGRLSCLSQNVGCADYVRFDGAFNNGLLPYYYCASDIFIMPARYIQNESVEGFGIVYAEAGYYGIPVIGGRAGGVPDAIVDLQTGLLVDPENPGKIAEAIITLLRDPFLRRKLGSAGQKRVRSKLTWDAVAERIVVKMKSTIDQRK